tara:strand:- start:103 stop:372 length:270 start_codon:yes stop_codon:yes gene_type:complete
MPSAIRPSQVTLLYHRESILAAYRDMSSADQPQTRLAAGPACLRSGASCWPSSSAILFAGELARAAGRTIMVHWRPWLGARCPTAALAD